jgi:hypothetical protein
VNETRPSDEEILSEWRMADPTIDLAPPLHGSIRTWSDLVDLMT